MNALRELSKQGQSIWLDYIEGGFIQSGELERLVQEDGVRGLTSNPTVFEKAIAGSGFATLRRRGARVQRPLWASTGTKNPGYSDVLYVENLIGPETVNTLPPATLNAFKDHGRVRGFTLEEGLKKAASSAFVLGRPPRRTDGSPSFVESNSIRCGAESSVLSSEHLCCCR